MTVKINSFSSKNLPYGIVMLPYEGGHLLYSAYNKKFARIRDTNVDFDIVRTELERDGFFASPVERTERKIPAYEDVLLSSPTAEERTAQGAEPRRVIAERMASRASKSNLRPRPLFRTLFRFTQKKGGTGIPLWASFLRTSPFPPRVSSWLRSGQIIRIVPA
jgi:hypothetical protein